MRTFLILIVFYLFISAKAQQTLKDTIYFKYDTDYITMHVEIPKHLYIKDGSGTSYGNFYFTEIKTIKAPNVKSKVACLKKFIRSSKFYDKKRAPKLNDYALYEEFEKFIPVFVKKTNGIKEYILTDPSFEIE
ncbi:hypothetical protein [Flavobacterium ajazii]|uniref:hypothetical protein n=1 Tax=Flavobacterium ajazii TaxID=2692318 RepID=UPI0013D124DA|nr:hypothetical protein [Flavobacterium ajazii]